MNKMEEINRLKSEIERLNKEKDRLNDIITVFLGLTIDYKELLTENNSLIIQNIQNNNNHLSDVHYYDSLL